MSRVVCLAVVGLTSFVDGLLAANAQSPDLATATRPNIVVVLTDDQRFDANGYSGHPVVETPALDRLAAESTRFDNAFVTTAICTASRASILTGAWESIHKITNFGTPLPNDLLAQSYLMRLKDAGYHTGFVGKWGLGGQLPADRFDAWFGFGGQGIYFPEGRRGGNGPKDDGTGDRHLTDRHGDRFVEFLDQVPGGRPFVVQVATKATHVNDPTMNADPFPPAVRHRSLFPDPVPHQPLDTAEAFAALPAAIQRSEARIRWEPRFGNEERYQRNVRNYYRLIVGVDEMVARMRSELEARGLWDNTVFLFTSDHGAYLGDRGLAGKWFMHDESIRVPMLLRVPGQPSGRSDAVVLNVDIAPTLLDLAGLERSPVMQGRSLRPLLGGQTPDDWRDGYFYEHHFSYATIPELEGVRGPRYKYVRYAVLDEDREELFDLQADPGELTNLVDDPKAADALAEMRDRWRTMRQQVREPGRVQ